MLEQALRTHIRLPTRWRKPFGGLIAGTILVIVFQGVFPSHPPVAATEPFGQVTRNGSRISPEAGSIAYPKALVSAFSSSNSADKDYAFEVMLPELADRNIAAAARMAEDLKPWAWREEVMLRVAKAWAAQNPGDAAAWALRLADAGERRLVFAHVCIAVATTDPARALELAQSDDGNGDPALQEQLIQLLAAKNPEAALESAAALPDEASRHSAFAKVAMARSVVSPMEAAHLVAERLPPGPLQDETALAVLHQWILRDAAGARAWVGIFPDGALLQTAEAELTAAANHPMPE